jgi:hypothetical protein
VAHERAAGLLDGHGEPERAREHRDAAERDRAAADAQATAAQDE